jgi:hypothetical protein
MDQRKKDFLSGLAWLLVILYIAALVADAFNVGGDTVQYAYLPWDNHESTATATATTIPPAASGSETPVTATATANTPAKGSTPIPTIASGNTGGGQKLGGADNCVTDSLRAVPQGCTVPAGWAEIRRIIHLWPSPDGQVAGTVTVCYVQANASSYVTSNGNDAWAAAAEWPSLLQDAANLANDIAAGTSSLGQGPWTVDGPRECS